VENTIFLSQFSEHVFIPEPEVLQIKFEFRYVRYFAFYVFSAARHLAYSMAIPEPQESAENQYLGHRMLFTLENQRSYQGNFHL
jgi:hypothetical protein